MDSLTGFNQKSIMIGVFGINHKTASQDVRQLFSFSKKEIVPFSEMIRQNTGIAEIVVLSTCHRTELYYYLDKPCNKRANKQLYELLHNFKNVDHSYEDLFYKYSGSEAVKHLFRVTSGIDSVVIGEDQVVKQVKEAYMHCTEAVLTEAVLMRLFQKCFETSKRVRTETEIRQGASSLSYVAVDLCGQIFENLADKKVLLIGSGETGKIALHHLVKRGVTKNYVSNRTLENALTLAAKYNSSVVDFDRFREVISECDIVIVATGAQEPLIRKSDVFTAQNSRNNEKQVFIDLSVPRNIESSVSELGNVQLFGVDDMQKVIDDYKEIRQTGIDQATIIIDEMAEEYMLWFDCLALRPLIKSITSNMQMIRDEEMLAYKQTEDSQKFRIIDEYTNRMTQKYIGMIIKNLRDVSAGKPSPGSLNIVNKLFKFEK